MTPINKQSSSSKRSISVYDIKPLPLDENTSLGAVKLELAPLQGCCSFEAHEQSNL